MKESTLIIALISIAFMLWWIINEIQDMRAENHAIPDMISATMKAEFELQEEKWNVFLIP